MKKILTLLIIQKEDKILLGLKKHGFGMGKWNGFGGKVNKGETIEDAAQRELLEESGLVVQSMEKIGVLNFVWQGNPEIWEVNIFKAHEFIGQPQETEEMRPRWFLLKDIPFEAMWPDDKHWLPLFLENKKFKGIFLFNQSNVIESYNLYES
ncbi:MAG: hypothetical protein A3D44_03155 [Candidatus Staskawiczbacteria bacterium RIFCSPHIGHO2_02_FULL_42_22]|uniref:Oxidized purine nucleoside triphosphate hydrolase n=1 Tax=Candidatus Staskawiczbacteria bacterium RIFCSPHIGHO2_02_FULL_42_22 TaxID=1802207 RepID=A0A1G2I5U9_9BACT|nr:MAG: hypothetical protein A3D44_03155 [Candidatus Staskawiczbacteria bacterium RIFCSPHIGHO2_02_FULL_42_22]